MKGKLMLQTVDTLNKGDQLIYKSEGKDLLATIDTIVGYSVKLSFTNSPCAAIVTRTIELQPKLRRAVVVTGDSIIPVHPKDLVDTLDLIEEDIEFEIIRNNDNTFAAINKETVSKIKELRNKTISDSMSYTPSEVYQLVYKALWVNEPVEGDQEKRQFAADWWQKHKKK